MFDMIIGFGLVYCRKLAFVNFEEGFKPFVEIFFVFFEWRDPKDFYKFLFRNIKKNVNIKFVVMLYLKKRLVDFIFRDKVM